MTRSEMNDEGYGAVAATVRMDWFMPVEVEIQVHPTHVNIYRSAARYRDRKAVVTDATARNIAAELCNGNGWLDVLADRLDEVPPTECDHDFRVADLLRRAV